MKTFLIKWGAGSVLGIKTVYKTMTTQQESIDDIDPLGILPDEIRKKVYYLRKLYPSETKRNYDYGSWSEFIEVEEIKETD